MSILQGVLVFCGAGVGGVLRWLLGTWMDQRWSEQWWNWSIGTLCANVLGSFSLDFYLPVLRSG